MSEDRLVRALEEAKELYLRRPKKGQSFFGKMVTSFNRGIKKAMSRNSLLGSDSVSSVQADIEVKEWKQEKKRARRKKGKGADHEPESLAKAIMSRNEDGYGVYTFEFESVDAEDRLRSGVGRSLTEVRCHIPNQQEAESAKPEGCLLFIGCASRLC